MTITETEIERLVVRLTGEGGELKAVLDNAVGQVTSAAGLIERSTDKMGAGTVAAGVLIAGTIENIGHKMEELGHKAIHSWMEQEDANVAMRSALEANGREVEATFKQYEEFANSIQRTTRYADESVTALLTQAEMFDLTGKSAEQATKSAIALAALPGARGSADMMLRLAAAIEKGDVAGAMLFARFVPALRHIKDETKFLAEYQRLVTFGFQAEERATNTLSGQFKQMGNAISDLMEDFGQIIAEGLKPAVEWVKRLMVLLKGMPPEMKRWVVVVSSAAVAFVSLGVALSILTPALAFLGAGFSLLVNPITLAIAAVAGLGYWILFHTKAGAAAIEWFGKQWAKIKTYVQPAIDDVVAAIAAGRIELVFEIMWLHVERIWIEGMQKLRSHFDLGPIIKHLAESVAIVEGFAKTIWGGVTGGAKEASKAVDDLNAALEELGKSNVEDIPNTKLEEIKKRLEELNKRVRESADAMHGAADAKRDLDAAMKPTNFGVYGSAEAFSATKPIVAALGQAGAPLAAQDIQDAIGKTPADAAARSIKDALGGGAAPLPAIPANTLGPNADLPLPTREQSRKAERLQRMRFGKPVPEVIPPGDLRIDEMLRETLDLWKEGPKRSAADDHEAAVERAKAAMESARKNREIRVAGMKGSQPDVVANVDAAAVEIKKTFDDVGKMIERSSEDAFRGMEKDVPKTPRDFDRDRQRIIDDALRASQQLNEDAAAARQRYGDEAFEKMMNVKRIELEQGYGVPAAPPEARESVQDESSKDTERQTQELKKESAKQIQELRAIVLALRAAVPIYVGGVK